MFEKAFKMTKNQFCYGEGPRGHHFPFGRSEKSERLRQPDCSSPAVADLQTSQITSSRFYPQV